MFVFTGIKELLFRQIIYRWLEQGAVVGLRHRSGNNCGLGMRASRWRIRADIRNFWLAAKSVLDLDWRVARQASSDERVVAGFVDRPHGLQRDFPIRLLSSQTIRSQAYDHGSS